LGLVVLLSLLLLISWIKSSSWDGGVAVTNLGKTAEDQVQRSPLSSSEQLEFEEEEARKERFWKIFKRGWDEFEQKNFSEKLLASGGGSMPSKTTLIRDCLPRIINEYGITSILDLPCGDFGWMFQVLLHPSVELKQYTGVDIVADLVEYHQSHRKLRDGTPFRPEWEFLNVDGVKEVPPQRDLVFTRDLLQHLSPGDITKLIGNLNASGAKYWIVSNFPEVKNSYRRGRDGSWDTHLVNLFAEPYSFPPSIDECPDTDGKRMHLFKLPIPGF